MQTTSLEISKALQAAGFWPEMVDDATTPDYWHQTDIVGGQLTHRDEAAHISDLKRLGSNIPAATYDDLIPALGLDKPWSGRWWGYLKRVGMTPDTLAEVWLEENAERCHVCGGTKEIDTTVIHQSDEEIISGPPLPCTDCNGTGYTKPRILTPPPPEIDKGE
jgi:hypothetical protein